MIHKVEHVIEKSDYVTGTIAATSPWWLHYLEDYTTAYMFIGGAVLLTIRVAIAIRDWRNKGD